MQKEFARNILFTGAGFTKNFGGLLAKEMWSKIFNNPGLHVHPRLMDLLRNDFDYESVYSKIMDGEYTNQEKDSTNESFSYAYRILDNICREWIFRNDAPNPVNIYGVNKFLERFSGSSGEMGIIFTLNQDLFIERHFNGTGKILIHPRVSRRIPDAHKIISKLPLEKDDFIILPTQDELSKEPINPISASSLNYIKLHGSLGWVSCKGSNCYVIGKKKEYQIADEPLLSWYFKLFAEVLSKPDRKLFVIGYGFRDPHVNAAIANSINNSNLKIYILSPLPQSDFIGYLQATEHGETILKGLTGYFPYTLLEVFPSDQSESHAWREIVQCYFSN